MVPAGRLFLWRGPGAGSVLPDTRADIQAFLDKWAPLAEREEPDGWPLARRMAVEKEDPLAFDLRLQVLVNGVALFNKRSSCRGWNPCLPETHFPDRGQSRPFLKQYGLSSASGWQLWRAAFPWRTKSRPRVNSLVVTLEAQGPDALPGPCFSTGAPGGGVHLCPRPASRCAAYADRKGL